LKIVHLTCREGLSSVFMAQVATPMAIVASRGWDVTLAVTTPIGEFFRGEPRRRWRAQVQAVRERLGVPLVRLPSPPSRAQGLWSEVAFLRLLLRRHSGRDPIILHCRGPQATHLALAMRAADPRVRVIFDCRGINGIEYLYVRGFPTAEAAPRGVREAALVLESTEREAARHADAVICVSDAMRGYIVDQWQAEREKISVVPCCTDVPSGEQIRGWREQVRAQFGLADSMVFAYCGSLEAWQQPRACIRAFAAIRNRWPHAHFLAITTHPERMQRLLDEGAVPVEGRTVVSVAQHEVARYLAAADAGFLFRERSDVNAVASPVKFAEYLAAGVPVLISEGVGDYSGVVRSQGLGVVVDAARDDASWAEESAATVVAWGTEEFADARERCQSYASEHLNWDRAAGTIEGAYLRLLRKVSADQ
jgi:glycosyltransferase involved in cell wall biosynthesis